MKCKIKQNILTTSGNKCNCVKVVHTLPKAIFEHDGDGENAAREGKDSVKCDNLSAACQKAGRNVHMQIYLHTPKAVENNCIPFNVKCR